MKKLIGKLGRPFSKKDVDKIKTGIVMAAGVLPGKGKSPDEAYGQLFHDVQQTRVFLDGKSFVDLVPNKSAATIRRLYRLAQRDPNFNIHGFLGQHFHELKLPKKVRYQPTAATTAREHVRQLWKVLERRNRWNRGSLLMLPYKYIVPGGRFGEQFYWDSYFIMLGLAADSRWQLIEGMVKNYAYMIRRHGFIPTANRTYFTSRSQPPFFSHMLELLARKRGKKRVYLEYLPYLSKEYRFWVKKRSYLRDHAENQAYLRVVRMPNGDMLGRYYDNRQTPRPEMARDDVEVAHDPNHKNENRLFLDFRAGAESGWDFSSRWFYEKDKLASIHTTDIVPIDLNCLLYHMERVIAEACRYAKQKTAAEKYEKRAERRAETIREYLWNQKKGFFFDYDFRAGRQTEAMTLAAVFPLYVGIATKEQAEGVARNLQTYFLQPGGLLTTLVENGQQWDAPNGWAPLHWAAIVGLRKYGYHDLANKIRGVWLANIEAVFKKERRMVEKYDVRLIGGLGGGGEYPLQDGFGWTNGVYAALKDQQTSEKEGGK